MQRSLYDHILAYASSINKDVERTPIRRYSKNAIDYAMFCVENNMFYELKTVITGNAQLTQFQPNSIAMRAARDTVTQRNQILRKGVTLFATSRPLADGITTVITESLPIHLDENQVQWLSNTIRNINRQVIDRILEGQGEQEIEMGTVQELCITLEHGIDPRISTERLEIQLTKLFLHVHNVKKGTLSNRQIASYLRTMVQHFIDKLLRTNDIDIIHYRTYIKRCVTNHLCLFEDDKQLPQITMIPLDNDTNSNQLSVGEGQLATFPEGDFDIDFRNKKK